jgi:hypothetical protein
MLGPLRHLIQPNAMFCGIAENRNGKLGHCDGHGGIHSILLKLRHGQRHSFIKGFRLNIDEMTDPFLISV